VHAEGAAVSAQIGHAGPVGQRRVTGARPLSASSGFSPLGIRYHAVAAADSARVCRDFAAAAGLLADAGFAFVALGRALLREPDLVAKLRNGESQESLCIHCNKRVPTIYRGTHCVLVPPSERAGRRVPKPAPGR
jgi:2,4-dienoyl-CoA reductase-like NADH-dependent reductase (Old Yellow Enzyme family)